MSITAGGKDMRVLRGGSSTRPTIVDPLDGQASHPRWILDDSGIKFHDGSRNNYGAPSGEGVTVEIAPDGYAFFSGQVKGRPPGRLRRVGQIALLSLLGALIGGLAVAWGLEAHMRDSTRGPSTIIRYAPSDAPATSPAPAPGPTPTSPPSAASSSPVPYVPAVWPRATASSRSTFSYRSTPAPGGSPSPAPEPSGTPTPAPTATPSPTPTPSATPTSFPSPTPSSGPRQSPSPTPTQSMQP